MGEEMCPKRTGEGKCCYHPTGIMLSSHPPQSEEVCCFCGEKRSRPIRRSVEPTMGHGPHHPDAKTR